MLITIRPKTITRETHPANLAFVDIVHEDNGIGFEDKGPFSNVTAAEIARNEMHMTTWASFAPDDRKFEMTLLGPVQYMAGE